MSEDWKAAIKSRDGPTLAILYARDGSPPHDVAESFRALVATIRPFGRPKQRDANDLTPYQKTGVAIFNYGATHPLNETCDEFPDVPRDRIIRITGKRDSVVNKALRILKIIA